MDLWSALSHRERWLSPRVRHSEGAPADTGQSRVVRRGVRDILIIPGDEPVCPELAVGPSQALHGSRANALATGGPAAWAQCWAGPPDAVLFQHRFFSTA